MTDRIRTVIAEDEPAARALLRSMLAKDHRLELVAETGDGRATVEAVKLLKPALLFLDIQMPELNGFEVLEEIRDSSPPIVVFVTAYDSYAIRAFDVSAADYLLKPFDAERVERAVNTAVERVLAADKGEADRRLKELLDAVARKATGPDRIPVTTDGRTRFVEVDRIDWIEAKDHLLRIYAGKEVHLLRATLASMEDILEPKVFARVHRSVIVNTKRIQEVQPWFEGAFVLILLDGTKITTGRTYRDTVRRLLELRR